jgi:glycerol kinase
VLALASDGPAPRNNSEAHVMSYLLALDAGTGSIRAVIFDLSGHQVPSARPNGNT